MNRHFNHTLVAIALVQILFISCDRPSEQGTNRIRIGELKDYSVQCDLTYPQHLRHKFIEGAGSKSVEIGEGYVNYDLYINSSPICTAARLSSGQSTATYDLTPYLRRGDNSMRLVPNMKFGCNASDWSAYLGRKDVRSPLIKITILRGRSIVRVHEIEVIASIGANANTPNISLNYAADNLAFSFPVQ